MLSLQGVLLFVRLCVISELQKELAVLAGGCVPINQGRKVCNTLHKKKFVSITLASLVALSLLLSFYAVSGQGVQQAHATSNGQSAAQASTNPYGDPNLVSMFDGKTLNGWTLSQKGEWVVKNGTIHSTGLARGWIYYKTQAGSFRWIFNVRQIVGNHYPPVLIWGTTTPIRDALSALQFGVPNGNHWDYRPGHNNFGNSYFTTIAHTKMNVNQWAQCELVANQKTGVANLACCPLSAGATTCKAIKVLTFKDKTAGRVGPLAMQTHNAGIQDEYKGLYLESPVKLKPDQFITT